MNIGAVMKIKGAWEQFTRNHPKFPAFLQAAKGYGITEGTVIAITIQGPGREPLSCNVKITGSDLQLVNTLKDLNV